MHLKFNDEHQFSTNQFYLVPNEATDIWREQIKGLHINRAAAICSSGEVGLIALLPTVRKELVLIDHSYASLSVAMLKYLMLRELGPTKTRKLLTSTDPPTLRNMLDTLKKKLPKDVQRAYNETVRDDRLYGYGNDFVKTSSIPGSSPSVATSLVREWNKLPKRAVYRCATKLDKVKFVHGDLVDLQKHGQFDLIYLSNALEHSGRGGRGLLVPQIMKALRPGGYVILSYRPGSKYFGYDQGERAAKKGGWELVSERPSAGASINWTQALFRIPETKQEVAA